MRAAPSTAPTIVPVVLLEGLLSGDGGDEEVARGEVISDEELAVLEDFVAKNAVPVLFVIWFTNTLGLCTASQHGFVVDGLKDTVSPFSKKTPFPSSQHG